jgi:hypothetical protein
MAQASRPPTASGSSSDMSDWISRPLARAVGSGLACTSPGGWPAPTAANSRSPTRQPAGVPAWSCACPWRPRRCAPAATSGSHCSVAHSRLVDAAHIVSASLPPAVVTGLSASEAMVAAPLLSVAEVVMDPIPAVPSGSYCDRAGADLRRGRRRGLASITYQQRVQGMVMPHRMGVTVDRDLGRQGPSPGGDTSPGPACRCRFA